MNLIRQTLSNIALLARHLASLSSGNLHTKEYHSWNQALEAAGALGYTSDTILQATLNSTRKVIDGEKPFVRDAVLFDEPQHNYPFLFYMILTAAQNSNSLNVLDFGGALGSSYLSIRPYLATVRHLTWSIVEQPSYIDPGNELYSGDSNVHFYHDLDSLGKALRPHIIVLSGVLMYLEEPVHILRALLKRFPTASFLIDRTVFLRDRAQPRKVVVQSVPQNVFGIQLSYPMWLLSEEEILAPFSDYDIESFISPIDQSGPTYEFKGFFITHKRGY